jgi:hypothetical protein
MDEDKTREETGVERPISPKHEMLGEVDDRDVEEDADRVGTKKWFDIYHVVT